MPKQTHTLVFFDGLCYICNGFVRFLIAKDRSDNLRFASQQSAQGAQHLPACYLKKTGTAESIYVKTAQGAWLSQSDAVLYLLSGIGFPWNILALGRFLPTCLRNGLYNLIAKNRHRFGKKKIHCPLPDAHIKHRFL